MSEACIFPSEYSPTQKAVDALSYSGSTIKTQEGTTLKSLTPQERAENYAKEFPTYPKMRYDDRWLDAVWLLGADYRGSGFYGAFPPNLIKRLRALFPLEFSTGRVLHLFSGSLNKDVGGIRLDMNLSRNPPPDIFGDAHALPFADASFDFIVADPPYSPADAVKYGTPMVNRAAVFRELARVLKPGGHLAWLDIRLPMHRKSEWLWWGTIGIVRSTNHLIRGLTFYQRRENTIMSNVKARIAAASEQIASALAILLGQDDASLSEAVASQKKNTKVRETGDGGEEDDAPVKKRGRGRPAGVQNKKKVVVEDDEDDDEDDAPVVKKKAAVVVDDDDDDDEDDAPVVKKKAAVVVDDDDDDDGDDEEVSATIPKDAALAELDREALKALAVANGVDPIGKGREDLTKLLQEKRDGGGKKAAKAKAAPVEDDDDDDEEAPVKKSKKVASVEEEVVYPKVKEMKSDLEAFFKLNKELLAAGGFFGGKVKKGAAKVDNTYDEIMGDVDMIKEAWADNVYPEVQSDNWKKMKAEAAEIEDDDDDE